MSAGLLLALSNSVGIFAALVTPWIANRLGEVRIAVLGAGCLATFGLGGLLLDPHHLEALWAVLLGCGQGATISLALMVMVLRSSDQHEAMALSGMAQGVGYLVAAVGPTPAPSTTSPMTGASLWRCCSAFWPCRREQACLLYTSRCV